MSNKYKMRRRDYCFLLAAFACLVIIVCLLGKSSYTYYKQEKEERAYLSAKLLVRSFTPSLKQAESLSRELAQTTVDEVGQVSNFAKRSRELLAVDYVQGLALISDRGDWWANPGPSPELQAAWCKFRQSGCRAYAIKNKTTVMVGPVTLKGGEQALLFYRPVYADGKLWGFAVVAARLDLLGQGSLENISQGGLNYRLYRQPVSAKKYELISRSSSPVQRAVVYKFQPTLASGKWKIYVSPKGGWTYPAKSRNIVIYASLLALALFSLLTAWVMRQAHIRQLKTEATVDPLTQICNRLGFNQHLAAFLREEEEAVYTLAMIDVDDFKLFNDLYGHQVGDQVLRQVACGLKEAIGDQGLAGRTGGDEFTIALFGMDAAAAQPLIQRILIADHQIDWQGQTIEYSLSIGYADSPRQGKQLAGLVSRADEALYEVKLSGKSGAQHYSGETSKPLRSQLGFTLHDIAANIPAALMIYKPTSGRILFVNQGTLRLLGYDSLWNFFNHMNTEAGHVVAPGDLDRVTAWLKRFEAKAAVGEVTTTLSSKMGKRLPLEPTSAWLTTPTTGSWSTRH